MSPKKLFVSKPMPILEFVKRIAEFHDDHMMFFEEVEELGPDMLVIVADMGEDQDIVPDEAEDYNEFQAIGEVKDIIKGKCMVAGIRRASAEKKTELLIEYILNDA